MGALNKLLIAVEGKPMVRRAAEALLAAQLSPVLVVTGHQREHVEEALKGLPLTFLDNADFAAGMSTSLRRGRPRDDGPAVKCTGPSLPSG